MSLLPTLALIALCGHWLLGWALGARRPVERVRDTYCEPFGPTVRDERQPGPRAGKEINFRYGAIGPERLSL